ncbi:MAG: hypothetical protein ACRD2X_00210 [Vicinamibacteraceae bacterium]
MKAFVPTIVIAMLLAGSIAAYGDEGALDYRRIRHALRRSASPSMLAVAEVPTTRLQAPQVRQRDSIWNGVLIGAGAGAAGGFLWAQSVCGGDDRECSFIATPVGVLAGAGIGTAVGAIVDLLHK